jgi:large conductance mechanosensitive channel protein
MSMMQEFKEFAMKGNVMDLAVGVIIGGAFGKIVDSVVADLIMPFIAWIMGGKLDFSGMFLVLGTIPEGTVGTSMRSGRRRCRFLPTATSSPSWSISSSLPSSSS